MARLGVELHQFGGRPFAWTTDAAGWQFWRRWGIGNKTADHRDWAAGGLALYAWIVPPLAPERRIPPAETRVICHSHGLQVVLYACMHGLQIDTLISIGSPVRQDMDLVTMAARLNIRRWLHVCSDRSDRMQWLGTLGDGALGIIRQHPLADVNHPLPSAGHSGVLHDPAWFGPWAEWVDWMRRA